MSAAVRCAAVDAGLGPWLVADAGRGVCFLGLDPRRARGQLEEWVRAWRPGAAVIDDPDALAPALAQLGEYARGGRRAFELALDLCGSEFERTVWRELCAIPFGRTLTYGELAERVGAPGGARAVGRAAGRNPVPVIVPCHRLVARGGLGGFSGGLDAKRRLLAHEGVPVANQTTFA